MLHATDIFDIGHSLKVVMVDATLVATEMVDYQPARNVYLVVDHPGNPVGEERAAVVF